MSQQRVIVLSAASDYFQALFCSEFEVKENRDNLVELKEIKSSIMKMCWSLCI